MKRSNGINRDGRRLLSRRLVLSLPLAIALPMLLALPGCQVLEVSTENQYQQGGVPLDKALLERITPGVTTRAEVLASLGPADVVATEAGQTTFTYQFKQQQNRNVRLIFLFRYRGQDSYQRAFYVRFGADDTVSKTWFNSPEAPPEPAAG